MSFARSIFEDEQIARLFSTAAFADAFRAFEIAYTRAMAEHGKFDEEKAKRAIGAMHGFCPDMAAIEAGFAKDGVPVPEFVRQLKIAAGDDVEAIHRGVTSQDLVDTATTTAIREANAIFRERLNDALNALNALDKHFGENRMMARTRMQAAMPISVRNRIGAWRAALSSCRDRLDDVAAKAEVLQLGGAIGCWTEEQGAEAAAIRQSIANELGLIDPGRQWHTDRSGILDYGNWLAMVSGAAGKVGQDITLMAQQGIGEIRLAGGGGSSAMPYKQNPVLAEKLVSIARFNATQLSALHQAMVHEQERSGAAWTLEWMTLPVMAEFTGRALIDLVALLRSVEEMGEASGGNG